MPPAMRISPKALKTKRRRSRKKLDHGQQPGCSGHRHPKYIQPGRNSRPPWTNIACLCLRPEQLAAGYLTLGPIFLGRVSEGSCHTLGFPHQPQAHPGCSPSGCDRNADRSRGRFPIEFLDDTIRDLEEIVRKWGVPILGTIVSYPHDKDTLITAKQPRSPITEAFRSLRTNLQFASFDLPVHTILVTSPSPEDGKTTVAANLASVIAQGGRTAVVVDADMRRPRLHKLLQISNRNGLSGQFIRYQDHLNGSVKPTEIEGLSALTSGKSASQSFRVIRLGSHVRNFT